MASPEFVQAVTAEVGSILRSDEACWQLGLTIDIVNGWRRYLDDKTPAAMVTLVREVAVGNKISLEEYEDEKDTGARAAAVMLLSTVDGFCRKVLMRPN